MMPKQFGRRQDSTEYYNRKAGADLVGSSISRHLPTNMGICVYTYILYIYMYMYICIYIYIFTSKYCVCVYKPEISCWFQDVWN